MRYLSHAVSGGAAALEPVAPPLAARGDPRAAWSREARETLNTRLTLCGTTQFFYSLSPFSEIEISRRIKERKIRTRETSNSQKNEARSVLLSLTTDICWGTVFYFYEKNNFYSWFQTQIRLFFYTNLVKFNEDWFLIENILPVVQLLVVIFNFSWAVYFCTFFSLYYWLMRN